MAALFAVTMAFAGAPAPLYVLYQEREGFGPLAVTLVFAAYAVGVAAALFLAGHLSDRFGRLRLIAPAVLLNVLAGLVFVTSTDLGPLLVARVLSGLGIGLLTATATAHLTELLAAGRAAAGRPPSRHAETISTAANLGGIGAGPLVAGILADIAPAPLHTPYLVFLFALVLGLLLVAFVPETVEAVDEPWHYRPQRVTVPAESRGRYAGALVAAFVSFAMFGLFTSLAPSFLAHDLHVTSHGVAGAVTFTVFGAAGLAQIVTGRRGVRTQHVLGVSLLTAGLVLIVGAMLAAVFPLLVIGGVVTGAGAGTLFKSGVGTVVSVAAGGSRAEALAGLFLAAYAGMSLPVVLLGILLRTVPAGTAVLAFGVLMLVLLAAASVLLGTGRRGAQTA
ncbi:putative arabinose efflux permease, MFS family [Promicromonospora thailandica]|uniref:Arabinose efflux permease, MFS family n=1 Tax=Promicromonospora thailandica TaxID=765201 RepID=A0A9X2JWX4_9MICO|nr:putative arabinose efflux permease, MFS family [Promicromonospora thailandica]